MKLVTFVGLRLFSPSLPALLTIGLQLILPSIAGAEEASASGNRLVGHQSSESQTAMSIPLFAEVAHVSIPTLEPTSFTARPILEPRTELHGVVTVTVTEQIANPSQLIERMVDVAVDRDTEKDSLDAKSRMHDKKWTRVVGRSKDMLEYMTSYQGFESSSEAADVILGEKLKLKNKSAIELVRQKRQDAAHLQLTCAVMEVATGLGLPDMQKRDQAVENGLQEMLPLVGSEQAKQCVQDMIAWSKQVNLPESTFSRDPWDVLAQRQKSKEMLACSLRNDDVVKTIEARLHKYNHLSNFSRATSKFVNTSLSLIAFSPTIASPAAQTAQFIFVACTGGPEEKKLLKEVYLDRRFESRFERLSQESIMAVNNYNHAILTHNPILYQCTQSLMEGLSNPEMVASFTSSQTVPQAVSQKVFAERI
jgi:hypothetical protein